jgi:hypothetical protein
MFSASSTTNTWQRGAIEPIGAWTMAGDDFSHGHGVIAKATDPASLLKF